MYRAGEYINKPTPGVSPQQGHSTAEFTILPHLTHLAHLSQHIS